jgi:rhamnose utilization protein RhaD (predicted bifunctional aldolase and dehydrogenase)/NAD(P)-dependent dehydrogenase (short-subunit alcohol dehydrogenase family)
VSPDDELDRLVERSRRIGADPALVLRGGGNTSTKLVENDHAGRRRRVMRIKGSGIDLATCGRRDFPGVWLDELERLRAREAMSDDEMVAYVRRCLVEPDSVRPSIETLLHAFLPAPHVDHVHADAICSLANAPDPAGAVRDALGADVALVPYRRPGFELAKLVAGHADARAVVLEHHGLVAWGETHEESYALMRELVDWAAAYVGLAPVEIEEAEGPLDVGNGPHDLRQLVRLRGRWSRHRRQVVAVDTAQRILADRPDAAEIAAMRSTPDHMLHIGPRTGGDGPVVFVPGLGCAAAGPDRRTARMRVELAAHSHASVAATLDRFGGASWLSRAEVEDFLDWPLERYRLRSQPAPELQGSIVIVTGAASGIGREVMRDLGERGAELVGADRDAADGVDVVGDLTDDAVADELVRTTVGRYGGLDAVVFCVGTASTGDLADVADADWRRSLETNLTSHFLLTKRVWPILREQGIGGSLVYVASKNAFSPGAGFGPYSVAKAGLVQLARIAALEGGAVGIRSNIVNPDAVFGGSRLWSEEVRRERAEAHGVAVEELESFYTSRSLLRREVTAHDVAEAVAFLVSDRSRATTGCVIPVDGGVPGAFPR